MALNTQTSDASANAAVNAICALANGGSLKIYSGAQPANANTAASGTLLATLAMSATAFANAANGVANANAITGAMAAATATAGWFRVYKSDGTTAVFDGSVGVNDQPTVGDRYNLSLNSIAIQVGATVAVSGLSYTLPEAGV
jgi:hypothetical protein